MCGCLCSCVEIAIAIIEHSRVFFAMAQVQTLNYKDFINFPLLVAISTRWCQRRLMKCSGLVSGGLPSVLTLGMSFPIAWGIFSLLHGCDICFQNSTGS